MSLQRKELFEKLIDEFGISSVKDIETISEDPETVSLPFWDGSEDNKTCNNNIDK